MRKVGISLILGIFTILFSSSAFAALTAQFDFSEGSGTQVTDLVSGYKLDLDNTSFSDDYPFYNVDGSGTPYSLNMSKPLAYTNSSELNSLWSADFSIALWFKNNNTEPDDRSLANFQNGAGTPDAFVWKINHESGRKFLSFYIQELESPTRANNFITDSITLDNSSWYFATVTYNQGTDIVEMYLNAVNLNANETTGGGINPTIDTSTGMSYIGNYLGASNSLLGLVDTVRIYDHVLSQSEITDLWNSALDNITLEFHDNITSTFNITSWNATINNNSYYWTAHPTPTNISSDNSLIDITVSAPYYLNRTIIGHNTTNNVNYNLQPYRFNLTVEFYNISGDKEQGFMVYLNGTETFNQSDVNGLFSYMLKNGTYNITVDHPSFNYYNQSLQLNLTSHFINVTGQVTNSVNFTFKDEDTRSLITCCNVTIELVSDIISYNKTTETGSVKFELLLPTTYTIRYSAEPDYPRKFYTITVTDRSFQALTLYLINDTQLSDVIVTITDQNLNFVENALIQLLRYDAESNSYYLSEAVTTDFAGQAVVHAILNEEWYKIRVIYNGDTLLTTTPFLIISENLNLQVDTSVDTFDNYIKFGNVDTNLSYSRTTNLVKYEWTDPTGFTSEACAELYRISGSSYIKINESCTQAASGIIFLGGINTSQYYYGAKGYVTLPAGKTLTETLLFGDETSPAGEAGIFYILILEIAILFVFTFSAVIALILLPLPFLAGIAIGILPKALLPLGISTFIVFLIAAGVMYQFGRR